MLKAGERLKEERLKQGLTLDDVSKVTKIKKDFLDAIERSDYKKLPASTFAQGFVRNYAQFLRLPENEVTPIFRREFDEGEIYRILPQGLPRTDFPLSRFKRSQLILIPLLFIFLLVYLTFQYKDAIVPPSVAISTPSENETIKSNLVLVSGSTNPENIVFVNNFPVSVDETGKFKKSISVFPGKVQISVRVINRFNKSSEKIVHIVVATRE